MTIADLETPLSFSDVPVAPNQQQLLTLMELYPNSSKAYEIVSVVFFGGNIDRDRLRNAYRSIITKHEALRTGFVKANNVWMQRIYDRPVEQGVVFVEDPHANDANIVERARSLVNPQFWNLDLRSGLLTKFLMVSISSDQHFLILFQHHIISDGQSVAAIWKLLFKIYGRPAEDSTEHYLHATFRAVENNSELAGQVSYWKAELDGDSGHLDLPTDLVRPSNPTFDGATLEFSIDDGVRASLNKKVAQTGVSVFVVWLAAWALTLSRLTGNESLVIGTPMSNRTSVKALNALGFFSNIVPFRVKLDGGLAVDEFLKQMQGAAIRAYENQSAPFYEVVKSCAPNRVEGMNPLFQAFFSYNKMESAPGTDSNLSWRQVPCASKAAQFDISLSLWETHDGVRAHLNYSTDLFREDTVKEIQEQTTSVIRELVVERNVALSAIPTISKAAMARVNCFNRTNAGDSSQQDLLGLFEAQVAKRPEARAIVGFNESLTYLQVDNRARALAAEFSQLGLGRGAIVGLFQKHGPSIIVGMLAAMKIGATYVPLDPKLPEERLRFILGDCTPDLLLINEDIPDWLRKYDCPKISTGSEMSWRLDVISRTSGRARRAHTQFAYILYTSGSTGTPKGVAVARKSLSNFIHAMIEVFGLTERESFLALTSISFDISALELLLPLTIGAQVVFSNYYETLDVVHLSRTVEANGVTFIQATPSAWRSIIIGGWEGRKGITALSGGEPLPLELASLIEARVGELWNMYGPTETTIWSTCHKFKVDDLAQTSRVSIGRPILNTVVEILDRDGNRVPIGAIGEICIGGVGLSDGYFRRQDLTDKCFVELDLPGSTYTRFYRTGDTGRWLNDGTLDCLGRNDSQVKIRGHRIELGEIEHVLGRHPGVAAAAVIMTDSGEGTLVAFLEAAGGVATDFADIRNHLMLYLPSFMIPKQLAFLDRLPETPNRKVDKKRLGQILQNEAPVASQATFRSATELMVLDCWTSTLPNVAIERSSNFFEVGGHSLHAVRLIAKLNKQEGVALNVADIFTFPVFSEFVARVEEVRSTRSKIIHLRTASPGVPVVFLNSGDGTVNYIRPLLPFIPDNHPVLALDPFQLELNSDQDVSVEVLASKYLEILGQERPQGPYILVGWSAGGTIAIEMANQLKSKGGWLARVVLMDTGVSYPAPSIDYSGGPGDLSHVGLVRWISRGMPLLARQQLLNYAKGASLNEFIDHCVSSRLIEAFEGAAQLEAMHHMRCKLAVAMAKYQLPKPLEIQIVAFIAQDETGDDESKGWQHVLASDLTVWMVPGTHFSIVEEPNVQFLGRQITELLSHLD